jgi:hypothetical protein
MSEFNSSNKCHCDHMNEDLAKEQQEYEEFVKKERNFFDQTES